MALNDFARRILGFPEDLFNSQSSQPVSGPQASTAAIANPLLQQQQQDMQQAGMQRVGQLGMLLMAAGQRMTPRDRATILAQAPQYMDGMQRDMMTAAQARLMNAQQQAAQDELGRTEALRSKLSDPAYLQSIGITPEQAQALGPTGIQKLLENQAMANTPDALLDRRVKEAQIQHYLNSGQTKLSPQMVDLPGGAKGWVYPGSNEVTPITGAGKGTEDAPKKSEAEVKGYQFAQQTIDAYKKLADPEYQYALTSRTQQLANMLPYYSTPWSSEDYRSADAASSAMTDAILRNKSGATIHDPEIQDEIRRVIPQPGDTQAQIQDKVARQRSMIQGFIGAANPADRKALQDLFDKANSDLMNKYTKPAAGALPPGVRSIQEVR
jgi:hypothetical protein